MKYQGEKMKKFLSLGLMIAGLATGVFGVDYSKMSNDELINQSGTFAPKEALSYLGEISKRMQTMSAQEMREFRFKLNEARLKAEESMIVKDLRERNAMICQELQKAPSGDHFLRKFAKRYCKQTKKERVQKAY